ncbi:hypothetical protein [Enterobacter ludwigii]|uniref:hypothetical protein n=1 Tax=Enterobacter ludwigii TaxID=299767 RepID=UPI0021C961D0|nr:hypothetical protein [Enterobacter ludwigii]MCU2394203.1 hypothetical protein [Enterobacter ludwigii]
MEFTKEQLHQIEAAAKEVLWPVVWSEKKAREHFIEKITPKVVLKLARIALASLEAEGKLSNFVASQESLGGDFEKVLAENIEELYVPSKSAAPAPVSVPDEMTPKQASRSYCGEVRGYRNGWNACRASMLQGADGNSPVIPDGWVMVPVEPTEDMIVNGFESEPDESFSDEKEWEVYDAMSGCQQAAHRAKLCWAAMIAAAPKPE